MDENEKQKLEHKLVLLIEVLDFYSKHKEVVNMTNKEYENHINDILDEINETKQLLGLK